MADRISAEQRTVFGKGAARKLRAAGKVPAVIYGHGADPEHVSLPAHELSLIVRRANAVLEFDLAGRSRLALVKDVQKDPVRQVIEHVDLITVRSGETVQVEVPVHLEGETAASTVATLDSATLTLDVEATHIPERITIDVTDAEGGLQILAKDVQLPQGAKLAGDPEALVVGVSVAEDLEAESAGDTGVPAEGDVVPEDEAPDTDGPDESPVTAGDTASASSDES